jgi:GH24 family phage-related lysozyme (muramidase)
MRSDVQRCFVEFTERFEGHLNFMYLDVEGLVTTGCGNLIDPVSAALALPFVSKSDLTTVATPAQVQAEWTMVKGRTDMKLRGGAAYGAITTLAITEAALSDLIARELAHFQDILKETFVAFESWPADGQLGLLSMAWAMGPAFSHTWPHFTQACLANDWAAAGANCKMNEAGNPGLVPRNKANAILFGNAARAASGGMPLDALYYPRDLSAEPVGATASA